MNPVIRGIAIYIVVLIVFRIIGKRSLSESTTFDFVLLLIISEVTQQALVGQDYSLTGGIVLIVTLVTVDLIFTLLKEKSKMFGHIAEGTSLIIVDKGKPLKERMKKCKVEEDDILEAGRLQFGIEKMDHIKYAILERDGSISIIPKKNPYT
jgi:uncharacterized membrane protein YcaP (DUF421 family)